MFADNLIIRLDRRSLLRLHAAPVLYRYLFPSTCYLGIHPGATEHPGKSVALYKWGQGHKALLWRLQGQRAKSQEWYLPLVSGGTHGGGRMSDPEHPGTGSIEGLCEGLVLQGKASSWGSSYSCAPAEE